MVTFIAGVVVGAIAGVLVARRNKNKVEAAVTAAKEKAAEIKSKV